MNRSPKHSLRSIAPGRLQMKDGGGCLALFGLPFLGAGIFLTLVSVRVVRVSNESELPLWAWPLLFLMGLTFTAAGGWLVFGRSWTTLDTTRRTVVKEWGALIPMRAREYRLDDYSAVILGFQEGDSDSADRYPVSLQARHGPDLELCSSTTYADARERALAVAAHAGFPLEDASTDHPVLLSAEQAGQSLQDRLVRGHVRDEPVAQPHAFRGEVRHSNGSVQISLPVPRLVPIAAVTIGMTLLILLVLPALWQFFRQTRTPDPVAWTFLGFLVLFFAAPALAFLKARLGRTVVTASRDGILIEERGVWRVIRSTNLTASEILDVDYSTVDSSMAAWRRATEQRILKLGQGSASPPWGGWPEKLLRATTKYAKSRGVTVKTAQGLTTIGQGLGDDEVHYLHYLVRRALSGT